MPSEQPASTEGGARVDPEDINLCRHWVRRVTRRVPDDADAMALRRILDAVESAPPTEGAGVDAVDLARTFHRHYERLAPRYGYETREESAVPWERVPEANASLMVKTARCVLDELWPAPDSPTEQGGAEARGDLGRGHHPDCRFESFNACRERWEAQGRDVGHLKPMDPRAGFVHCAPGCPHRERDEEHAKTLRSDPRPPSDSPEPRVQSGVGSTPESARPCGPAPANPTPREGGSRVAELEACCMEQQVRIDALTRQVERLDEEPAPPDQGSDPSWVEGCPFCAYTGPSEIVYEDDAVYGIEPLNPVTLGHKLLIPKRHVADFTGDPDMTAAVARVAAAIANPEGAWNLITSMGEAATQTVGHLHFHLIPRREGDGLMLPWSEQPAPPDQGSEQEQARVLRAEIAAVADRLRVALTHPTSDHGLARAVQGQLDTLNELASHPSTEPEQPTRADRGEG